MIKLTLESAKELLHQNIQNQNLRRHCYAVGKVLRAYYNYYLGEGRKLGDLTADDWEITGLLHDADYELTKNNPEKHTVVLLEKLKNYEAPEEIINVFKSHNNHRTHMREPQTLLEWTLECCDELTGFIVAVALVMPNRQLSKVTVKTIFKKFKQKEFARAVDRNQILQCKEKVGVEPEKFVEISLKAMQENSDLLGL